MSTEQIVLTTTGIKLTDRMVRKGLNNSVIAGMFSAVWLVVIMNMPLQMYLEALGATGFIIGLTTTIVQISTVAQVVGAVFAEKFSKRKTFVLSIIFFQRLLWFIPAILPWILPTDTLSIQYVFLIVVTISAFSGQLITGPWLSWMTDLVPASIRGRFWGRRQQYFMVASLLTLWLSGYVLDIFKNSDSTNNFTGFSLVFCVAAIMGLLDVIWHLKIPEPQMEKENRGESIFKRMAKPLLNRDFRLLTFGYGFWSFGICITAAIANVYIIRTFKVDYSSIAAIAISASVGVILVSTTFGYVIDRLGARVVTIIAMIATPCVSIAWFFVNDSIFTIDVPFIAKTITISQVVLLLIITNFFFNAIASGAWLAQINILTIYVPAKGRTMALAVHYSFMGIIGSLGPLLGGYLMDMIVDNGFGIALPWGTEFTYMQILVLVQMAAIWFVAIPLLLLVKPVQGELPVTLAASRLFIANPIRVALSMYNIVIMQSSVPSSKRAVAAAKLGSHKYAVAIKDLMEKLDDPSFDVREAAVYALGEIGSNDAIEALIEKLEDPDSDLSPQLARALRQSKNPRSVEPLLKKLSDPDRETKRETARALGVIGDKRATSSLLSLLKSTDDNAIVNASSEALARLGELAAIYDILPRMHSSFNPVLRRSLAVAIGDLLIPNKDFYQVLTKEQKEHCSQIEKMIKALKKTIRTIAFDGMISEGTTLLQKCDQFMLQYEDKNYNSCATNLFELAIGISALFYGAKYGEDSTAFINDLIWRDQRFGIGVWYLDLMQQHIQNSQNKDDLYVDLIIGLYFLANWSTAKE